MIELDAMKKNWQSQKTAAKDNFALDKTTGNALSRLKKFEKKQFRINMGKTTGIILLFIYLIWSMLFATPFSVVKLIATVWIVISTAIFLMIYWRIQLKVEKLNVRNNSMMFIDEVLENFKAQKELFKKKFWIFGAVLTFGINLLYVDLLKGEKIMLRIGLHALVTLVMAGVIWGGIKFRMFRFKREYEPIVSELNKIKEDLKETK